MTVGGSPAVVGGVRHTDLSMYEFAATLWLSEAAEAAWYFVTVPEEISDEIEFRTAAHTGGFGSVRVEVTIGATTWRTSLFPDKGRQAYVLPVKKQVRDREDLTVEGQVNLQLELVEG